MVLKQHLIWMQEQLNAHLHGVHGVHEWTNQQYFIECELSNCKWAKCKSAIQRCAHFNVKMHIRMLINYARYHYTVDNTLKSQNNEQLEVKHMMTERIDAADATIYIFFFIKTLPFVIDSTVQFPVAGETWVHQTFWARTTL